jgi:hypothetical protein
MKEKRDAREKIIDTNNTEGLDMGGCIFAALCTAAWATSVCVSISNHLWILLLSTAIFFPIGIVHGFGYWMGFFH